MLRLWIRTIWIWLLLSTTRQASWSLTLSRLIVWSLYLILNLLSLQLMDMGPYSIILGLIRLYIGLTSLSLIQFSDSMTLKLMGISKFSSWALLTLTTFLWWLIWEHSCMEWTFQWMKKWRSWKIPTNTSLNLCEFSVSRFRPQRLNRWPRPMVWLCWSSPRWAEAYTRLCSLLWRTTSLFSRSSSKQSWSTKVATRKTSTARALWGIESLKLRLKINLVYLCFAIKECEPPGFVSGLV